MALTISKKCHSKCFTVNSHFPLKREKLSLQKFSHIWYTLPKLLTKKLKFKIQFWGRHACPRPPSMKLPLPTAIILKQTSSAEVRICDFLFCSYVNSCKSFNLCNIIVIFGLCPWAMPHIRCAPCPVIKFKCKTVYSTNYV